MNDLVKAHLAALQARISGLEAATVADVAKLNARHESLVRERWLRLNEEVEPMRREIENIGKKLADIEGMKAPAPVILKD